MPDLNPYDNWVNHWLSEVGLTLLDSIYNHEFVCRIPIPINEETGFLGKIHGSILDLKNNIITYNNNTNSINNNDIQNNCNYIKNIWMKNNDENIKMCQNMCNFYILHPRDGKFYCSKTTKKQNQ